MLLPNFFEDPSFKKLLSEMGIDIEKTFSQVTFPHSINNVPLEQNAIPRPNQPPQKNGSGILSRLTSLFRPKLNIDHSKVNQLKEEATDSLIDKALYQKDDTFDNADDALRKHKEQLEIPPKLLSLFPESIGFLDKGYHSLLSELLENEKWDKETFGQLVRKNGLMPSSSLDIINAWSDEHLGDFILEDNHSLYKVNQALIQGHLNTFKP